MTPVEWMAAIIAIIVLIKLIVILIKPSAWMEVVDAVYKWPIVTVIVSLILAYYTLTLLLEEITIIQIFASMLFLMFLMTLSMVIYKKEIVTLGKKMLKKDILKRAWLAIIVWLVLCVWVLKELFF